MEMEDLVQISRIKLLLFLLENGMVMFFLSEFGLPFWLTYLVCKNVAELFAGDECVGET